MRFICNIYAEEYTSLTHSSISISHIWRSAGCIACWSDVGCGQVATAHIAATEQQQNNINSRNWQHPDPHAHLQTQQSYTVIILIVHQAREWKYSAFDQVEMKMYVNKEQMQQMVVPAGQTEVFTTML